MRSSSFALFLSGWSSSESQIVICLKKKKNSKPMSLYSSFLSLIKLFLKRKRNSSQCNLLERCHNGVFCRPMFAHKLMIYMKLRITNMFTRGSKTITSCRVKVWSPVRLSLKRRQGYQAGFQRSCVKVNVYAGRSKRLDWKFFEANCGVALVSRGRLSLE